MGAVPQTEGTFEINASPVSVSIRMLLATPEAAKAAAAQFPKSLKVRGSSISGLWDGKYTNKGWVTIEAIIHENGVNGGVNETGIKRIQSFRKHAARLGYTVTYRTGVFSNELTETEFEAAVA